MEAEFHVFLINLKPKQKQTNFLSVFDHSVGLAFKGLRIGRFKYY